MGFLGISGKTWKKIGSIALKAAPIVAAPFTGGASLLALGAGAGAASGLLSGGGLKGALLGAGLGAIPGGGGTSSALTGGVKAALPGLAKGALTNFATGTATGLATGQGVKSSLAGGGMGALSGFGTTGAGGVGQAAKTIGKGTALNVGGAYASKGLQAAGVPGAIANQGGNVFSNYLGKQMTPTSTLPDLGTYDFGGGPGDSTSPSGIGSYLPGGSWQNMTRGAVAGAAGGILGGGGGATGGAPTGSMNAWPSGGSGGGTGAPTGNSFVWHGGGGTPAPAGDGTAPQSWTDRWGSLITQGAGVAAGALIGRQAQKNAMQRSPEEQAALTGAQGSAGTLGRVGGQLAQQGQNYLQKPGQYFQTLLGGNRAAMNQAVAAPIAQLTGTYRGAERNLQQQGIRGAARDVAAADLNRDRASKIAGLTTGVQPYAAEQLAKMGDSTLGQAGSMLGNSGTIYSGLLGQGFTNRKYARQEGADTAKAIGGLARDAGEVVFKKSPGSGTSTSTSKNTKNKSTTPPGPPPTLSGQNLPGWTPPTTPTGYPSGGYQPPATPSLGTGIPGWTPPTTGSGYPGDYDPYGNG